MSEKHTCPRRAEVGMDHEGPIRGSGKNRDTWDYRTEDGPWQCSWCGSVHPEYFLVRLRLGDELGPTDKDYKAYLDYDNSHYKFYYQHLSLEQRHEFIDMLNAQRINFGFPGYFTRLPYFIKVKES